MCKLIEGALAVDESRPESAADEPHDGFVCRLQGPEGGKAVALEVLSGRRVGYLFTYTPQRGPEGEETEAADPARTVVEAKMEPDTRVGWETTSIMAPGIMTGCMERHNCGAPFRHAGPDAQTGPSNGLYQQADAHVLGVLPSRLIYLDAFGTDDETADAILIELDSVTIELDPGAEVAYAALSYCWGSNPANMYKAETATLEARKERIWFAELPRTFQDAFRICRRLCIPALWIDALCIVQDSKSDWEAEMARMGGIYASSTVTIAADASTSVHGGILDALGSEPERDRPGSVRITNVLAGGRESTLVFYDRHSAPSGATWTPDPILQSPLSSRAWCMQERMLSSRTLHFTRQGLIWECRDTYFNFARFDKYDEMANVKPLASIPRVLSTGIPAYAWGLRIPANVTLGFQGADDKPLELADAAFETCNAGLWHMDQERPGGSGSGQGEDVDRQAKVVLWWNRNVVAAYSGRRLTYLSDRLPAISGMAKIFASQVRAPYAAGMWLAELDGGLEWMRAGDTFQDAKIEGFPSFSWAAHPGPVIWPYHVDTRAHGPAFDLVSHSIVLAGLDPHGRVTAAQLTLRGHLRAVGLGPAETDLNGRLRRSILDEAGNVIGTADLDLDAHRFGTVDGAHCFLLYKNFVGFLRLLILVKASGSNDNEYWRIGIGVIWTRHASWLEETEKRVFRLG